MAPLVMLGSCEKRFSSERERLEHTNIRITGVYQNSQLQNPTDIIRFKDRYVATELYQNRLAIFDDLSFSNLRHFDPTSIGKSFRAPHFLAISPWNTLLISNGWGSSIVEIADLNGNGWKSFSGKRKKFNAPHGICVDRKGWIYVGDSLNSRLVRFRDMQGTDWQEFSDIEKRISYIRELVCADNEIWISNSYEQRKGLNPGIGSNILKITDFKSGKAEEVIPIKHSNCTGLIVADHKVAYGLFAAMTVQLGIFGAQKTKQIISANYAGLGAPYGMYGIPKQNLYFVTFFGTFENRSNPGGFVTFSFLTNQ